jgi:hypothetical protein
MTARSRRDVLRDLVQVRGDLDELVQELGRFPWDYPDELVWLTPTDAVAVLSRFLAGELSAGECERWADALEGRDDLGFQEDAEDILADLVFELANPVLMQPLSIERARWWIVRLERRTPGGLSPAEGGRRPPAGRP